MDFINWDIEIADIWESVHHLGHVHSNFYDNLIFTGLAGGFLDPIFGFGNIASLESGGAAAKHIANKGNFNDEIKLWKKRNREALILRRYMDKFTDDDFDRLVQGLKSPGFRSIASKSNANIIYILSKLVNTFLPQKVDTVLYPNKEGKQK